MVLNGILFWAMVSQMSTYFGFNLLIEAFDDFSLFNNSLGVGLGCFVYTLYKNIMVTIYLQIL